MTTRGKHLRPRTRPFKHPLLAPIDGVRMRQLRTEIVRVTQGELCDLLGYGYSPNTISKWENGILPIPVYASHAMRWVAHLAGNLETGAPPRGVHAKKEKMTKNGSTEPGKPWPFTETDDSEPMPCPVCRSTHIIVSKPGDTPPKDATVSCLDCGHTMPLFGPGEL